MGAQTNIEIAESGWGVYEEHCYECGKTIVIVATVHSVEHGYAEAFNHGAPVCQVCNGIGKMVWN